MNKKLQTVIGMVFLFTSAIGQTTDLYQGKDGEEKKRPQTYFTPIVKLVSTNLNYGRDNSSVADYKKQVAGVQAGVAVQAGITSNFSLLSEFYFMMKGGKLNANNPLTNVQTTYRFYTLELPVLARVQVGKIHLNAGPSIAYNLSGTEKTAEQSQKVSFKSGEGFRRFEAGIQMGGGYMFSSKHKQMELDIRYNLGLTNISQTKEMFNRSIVVSLLCFRPGKSKSCDRGKSL